MTVRTPGHRRIGRGRAIAVVLALALVVASCGGSGETAVAAADSTRVDAAPAEARGAASAIGGFGWDLYHQLADGDDNLVFSPHSIGVALAMTGAGAAGDTAIEMDEVLHLGELDDPHTSLNALDLALTDAAGTKERPDGTTAEVTLDIANALWAQDGFGFEEPFLVTLAENYGAGVRLVDYADDPEAARERINEWVAGQTNERIPELLAPGILSTLTRLVLTNAVFLQAPWAHPFDDGATAEGPFTRLDGSETPVDLMSVSASFRHGRGDGWQAIELPYLGGDLAMVVIVPDPGAFETVTLTLDAERFQTIVDALQPSQVDLTFPAFEFSTEAGLVPVLESLGLQLAFDPERADFSAMSGEAALYVSDVVHQAFIAVDEAGTEAAAATAVVMDLTAAPADPVRLVVDRPFVFVIRHGGTGGVLFAGRVVDP